MLPFPCCYGMMMYLHNHGPHNIDNRYLGIVNVDTKNKGRTNSLNTCLTTTGTYFNTIENNLTSYDCYAIKYEVIKLLDHFDMHSANLSLECGPIYMRFELGHH